MIKKLNRFFLCEFRWEKLGKPKADRGIQRNPFLAESYTTRPCMAPYSTSSTLYKTRHTFLHDLPLRYPSRTVPSETVCERRRAVQYNAVPRLKRCSHGQMENIFATNRQHFFYLSDPLLEQKLLSQQ